MPDRLTFISRLQSGWCHPFRDRLTASATPAPAASVIGEVGEDPVARHTGTVLHRTLKQIATEGVAVWNSARIERQQRVWELQLRQLAVADTGAAVATLTRAVETMLGDETGRWLLCPHGESACELALGHREAEGSALSVIDRTFVDGEVRWIVDYKSGEPGPGESAVDFLQRQATVYREQLQRYRSVFMRREPQREIRIALYFPLLARLQMVD